MQDVQLHFTDSGFLLSGNNAANAWNKTAYPSAAVYNSERQENYLLSCMEKAEKDRTCHLWFSQYSSSRTLRIRDMMFNTTTRQRTAERLNITVRPIITTPLFAPGASDFSLYSETDYPNLYGAYSPSTQAVGDLMDALYAKGARTYALFYEDDEPLDQLYYRNLVHWLDSIKNREDQPDWKQLLFRKVSFTHRATEYQDAINEIYRKQREYNPTDETPDVVLFAGNKVEGNPARVLQLFQQFSLGPDNLFFTNAITIEQKVEMRALNEYNGLILSDIFLESEVIKNENITTDFFDLGTEVVARYAAQNTLSEPISLVSAVTLIAIQTALMAMVRSGCNKFDTFPEGVVSYCIRQGIYSPCSTMPNPNTESCLTLGAEKLDVNTWYGRVSFSKQQVDKSFIYSRMYSQGGQEVISLDTVNMTKPDDWPYRHFTENSDVLRIVTGVLTGVALVGCLFGVGAVERCGKYLVIRSSAKLFLQLILLGALVLYSSIFWLIVDVTDFTCNGFVWFSFTGWVLAFGGLLVKTHRVDQIFKVQRKTRLHDRRLLLVCYLPLVGAFILYLSLWTVLDPVRTTEYTVKQSAWTECNLNTSGMYVGVGMQVLMLIWAVVLAFRVRNTPSAFNEAFLISASVYNWVVIHSVILVLIYLMNPAPNTQLLFLFLYGYLPLTVMLCMMFVPKAYAIYSGKGDQVKATTMSQKSTNQPGKFSTFNTDQEQIRRQSCIINRSVIEKPVDDNISSEGQMKTMRAEVGRLIVENTRLTDALARIQNPHVAQSSALARVQNSATERTRDHSESVSSISSDRRTIRLTASNTNVHNMETR
ncbi:hypothetical protein SARC_10237 [Sphaeroforma arctica JP610]|uniref:G-protein coupled receptors family 3 profile domain-containing protein n=1 Tax=Sphaeroforma arctica JP610 TaxID=667725 RepID=A0A0L0FMP5_9EUKA|nr:hypothetical protein SARC_10237 [Sphaeroforma arctica JP610]KNC77303.1 hypothetical protein SARC_10237 [Sphaeroforma arctica JP610]|eukprot:XP_014151205.1 hypothetical protein SARC_10237 [Sphaeroforma arctica JP610]